MFNTVGLKYELEQVVWCLRDNKVHSAPVLSRMYVDNAHEDWNSGPGQKQSFIRFGQGRIVYATIHGQYDEDQLFASREELADSLK